MLYRNSAETNSDQSVTIITPGQFPGTSLYAREYAGLNNRCFVLQWVLNMQAAVVIKAWINPDAEGYIFGGRNGSNAHMSIRKQGNKIYWKMGTQEYSVNFPTDGDPHNYGFNNGRPWFDGAYVDSAVHSDTISYPFVFGGCIDFSNGSTDCIRVTGSGTAIRIYEAVAYANKTGNLPYSSTAHLYAVTDGTSSTTPLLYETREIKSTIPTVNGTAVSGVTYVSNVGDQVQYGITIEDLRYAFSCGYDNVVALFCAKGGSVGAEADDPDIIYDQNNVAHEFAFCMKDVPLPAGYRYVKGANQSQNYVKGDLICGLRPYWHLWADGVKIGRGKDVRTESGNKMYVRYNILHDDGFFRLEDFIGYNNSGTVSRDPAFVMSDELIFEYHNSVIGYCENNEIYRPGRHYSTEHDHEFIYAYDTENVGTARIKVGNLVDWTTPSADIRQDSENYHTGVAASVEFEPVNKPFTAIASAIGRTTETFPGSGNLKPFGSDTDDTIKAKFRDGKDAQGKDINWKVRYLGMDYEGYSLHEELYNKFKSITPGDDGKRKFMGRMQLSLVNNASPIYEPTAGSLVYTSKIMPTTPKELSGIIDPKYKCTTSATVNYRFFIRYAGKAINIGGQDWYVFPVQSGQDNARITRLVQNDMFSGIALEFSLWSNQDFVSGDPGTAKRIDGSNNPNLQVTFELTRQKSDGTIVRKTITRDAVPYVDSVPFGVIYAPDTVFPDGTTLMSGYDMVNVKKYMLVAYIYYTESDYAELMRDFRINPEASPNVDPRLDDNITVVAEVTKK